MLLLSQVKQALGSMPTLKTRAEPRPHAYMADDGGELRPFGAFPPVKPVPLLVTAKPVPLHVIARHI